MFRKILLAVFLSGLVSFTLNFLMRTTEVRSVLREEDKPIEVESDPLRDWIETKLLPRENCPPEGMMDGKSKSYGPLCFKETTFRENARRLKMFLEAEDHELLNLTSGRRESVELAYRMIKKDYNNWRHWENTVIGIDEAKYYRIYGKKGSTKGVGLPPKDIKVVIK